MNNSGIETNINDRDLVLDTLKFLLMFFVVLGHVLEEFGVSGYLGTVRSMIYCFHMPTFVFLSGYFSKNILKVSNNSLRTCLIPFMIYNTLFCLLAGKFDFLTPLYLYWYLLSLFFWRISAAIFQKVRFAIVISVILALYVGTIREVDRFLAISRTVCFFPFFLAGMAMKPESLKRLRCVPIYIPGGCIILCETLVVWMDRKGVMPSKMYELIESYGKTMPESLISGVLCRIAVLVIAIIMVFSILSICRRENLNLALIGRRTAAILVFSGFVVKILSRIGFRTFPWLKSIDAAAIIIVIGIPISIVVMLICGNRLASKLYDTMNNIVYRAIIE